MSNAFEDQRIPDAQRLAAAVVRQAVDDILLAEFAAPAEPDIQHRREQTAREALNWLVSRRSDYWLLLLVRDDQTMGQLRREILTELDATRKRRREARNDAA